MQLVIYIFLGETFIRLCPHNYYTCLYTTPSKIVGEVSYYVQKQIIL